MSCCYINKSLAYELILKQHGILNIREGWNPNTSFSIRSSIFSIKESFMKIDVQENNRSGKILESFGMEKLTDAGKLHSR